MLITNIKAKAIEAAMEGRYGVVPSINDGNVPFKLTLDANNSLAIPLAEPDEFGRKESTLIVCYPEGDYDTISAKNFDGENLRKALYDAREIGELPPDCDFVELPSGVLFFF